MVINSVVCELFNVIVDCSPIIAQFFPSLLNFFLPVMDYTVFG